MTATPTIDEAHFASRARPGVRALKAYDPGLDLVALRARHGDALVELGSNENPYGPSPAARDAVTAQLSTLHRYPDPRGGDLKRALARHHGIGVDALLLGNGSHELLMLLAQAFAGEGDEVVFPAYGFAVFALAAQSSGARPVVAVANPRDALMPLGHDLDAVLAAIGPATRLVYLANPNNPTGTWCGREAMEAFLARLPAHVICVVDEAYAELADADDYASMLPRVATHPQLVVTRTFSKAYALAGMRTGYLVAHPGLVAVLERLRESFNVNGPALAACEAALGDEAHLASCRRGNAAQREALAAALHARGLEVFPSQTNFLLVGFGRDAGAIEQALVERAVVPRPMAGYGLPDCLRLSVGTEAENRRLLAVLDEVLA